MHMAMNLVTMWLIYIIMLIEKIRHRLSSGRFLTVSICPNLMGCVVMMTVGKCPLGTSFLLWASILLTVGGEYILGAPQVSKVSLKLPGDKVFVMEAKGLSKENKYVRSVEWNGNQLSDFPSIIKISYKVELSHL